MRIVFKQTENYELENNDTENGIETGNEDFEPVKTIEDTMEAMRMMMAEENSTPSNILFAPRKLWEEM